MADAQTPVEDTTVFEAVADRYPEDVILHGHSHYPFEAAVAGTTFVNPGSVGLQRDGWPVNRAALRDHRGRGGRPADGHLRHERGPG